MPYGLIFDVIVLLVIVGAIVKTGDERARFGLGLLLAVIVGPPLLVTMRPMGGPWWAYTIFKVLAGLACLIYIRLPD